MNMPTDPAQTGSAAAVASSALFGDVLNPELSAVDADLREYFMADEAGRYVPKLPIMIQLVRLLRCLLEKGNNSQNGTDYGKDAKNDVEPKKLPGQSSGSPLVSVDGLDKILNENS